MQPWEAKTTAVHLSEVYKQGVMDMGGYEQLPNTEFNIEKITYLFEKHFFQNLILGMWESQGGP